MDFVENYRKHNVLWDISFKDYKNKHAKLDVLQLSAENFNCDVEMIKKIKNLQTAFFFVNTKA